MGKVQKNRKVKSLRYAPHARVIKIKSSNELLTTTKLKLDKFPVEIIENITKFITCKQRNRLRTANHCLRDICDGICSHEMKKRINDLRKLHNSSCLDVNLYDFDAKYEFAILRTLQFATWAYEESGYTPNFIGQVIELFQKHRSNRYYSRLIPTICDIKKNLLNYYEVFDDLMKCRCAHKERILYTLTFLSLLKNMKNTSLVAQELREKKLNLKYIAKGSWMGFLWTNHADSVFDYVGDRYEFLFMLIEMMISGFRHKAFRKVTECNSKLIVMGNDIRDMGRVHYPSITFDINIVSEPRVLQFISEAVATQTLHEIPEDEFALVLKINCREALKWGCLENYMFEIHPMEKLYTNDSNVYMRY